MYSHFSRFSRSSGNPAGEWGLPPGGLHSGAGVGTPPESEKWTVHILLECFLVNDYFGRKKHMTVFTACNG